MRKNVAKVYENFTFIYKSKVSLGSVSRFYLDIVPTSRQKYNFFATNTAG